MKKPIPFLFLLIFVFISGCDENEVQQISKEGAVETIMNVDHLDQTHDIIITTHKVWIKNQLAKTIIYKDTIPSLGLTAYSAYGGRNKAAFENGGRDKEAYCWPG